ncbi:MAG: CPBP family intramembrane metalloprotease [Bacteroidales bacterium]|jgi:membrane protease YdiL (CAAX protease family)|nr:CPBP family intramembrane metalloprotease [Bacteroidales bacterium]
MYFLESILGKDNSFWKYVIVFIGAFLVMNTIGAIPLLIVVLGRFMENGNAMPMEQLSMMNFLSENISQNLFLFLMLIPHVVGLFTVYLLIKLLHKRTFSETVNGTGKIRWRRIFTGFSVWFLLMFIYLAISCIIDPDNFIFQFNITTFIPLFFIVIIIIPLQTTFEELLFRGYLAQGIGAWTKNRWAVIVIPSILFGLMHILNPEVSAYGVWETMPHYILFGLIFGVASILDDGIELAMGMHAANNIFGCLFVSSEHSALQTPAIFKQQFMNIQMETVVLLITGLLVLFFFSRKYKWRLSIMNKKIKPLEQISTEEPI